MTKLFKIYALLLLYVVITSLNAGEISYGDDLHIQDYKLFPVKLVLNSGETNNVFVELYPLREMHTYQTRTIQKGENVLDLLINNVQPDDSIRVYKEIHRIPALWITSESEISTIAIRDISEARLQIQSPEEYVFENCYDLPPDAILSDTIYRKLKQPIVASVWSSDSFSALGLYSISDSLKQDDLYLYAHLMMPSWEYETYDPAGHPSFSAQRLEELPDLIGGFTTYHSQISEALTESAAQWANLAVKIDSLEMLSEGDKSEGKRILLTQAEKCNLAKKQVNNIITLKSNLQGEEREKLIRKLFECFSPFIALPSPEGFPWEQYLLSKGVIALWLQTD